MCLGRISETGAAPAVLLNSSAAWQLVVLTFCNSYNMCCFFCSCLWLPDCCNDALLLLQVSQVVGRGFASLFNSYSGLPSSLEVRAGSTFLHSMAHVQLCVADRKVTVSCMQAHYGLHHTRFV